jgi:hypothetical protein
VKNRSHHPCSSLNDWQKQRNLQSGQAMAGRNFLIHTPISRENISAAATTGGGARNDFDPGYSTSRRKTEPLVELMGMKI